MPFRLAFIDIKVWSAWFLVELIVNILFFGDFIVNCLTAYYDSDGKLITDVPKILWNYAKSWMIIDFIAFFPFDIIAIVSGIYTGN